jgi:hypothetical protein
VKAIVAGMLVLAAARAPAQGLDGRIEPELRGDVIAASQATSWQGGAGLQIPAGYYARIGLDAAVGADVAHGVSETSGRVDVLARFLFDPFRQTRWGVSAGAGVSVRAREGDRVRPYLLAVMDLEAPRTSSGLAPAVQVGLGGGVRVGLVLRWAAPRAR